MKYSIGIDVSKDTLQVAIVKCEEESKVMKIVASKKFSNQKTGFSSLLRWSKDKCKKQSESPLFLMEATGVYHEALTDFLFKKNQKVSVELPNKIKYYAKSLNIKTKTDKIDAVIIAKYALERQPRLWEPLTGDLSEMRSLSRQIMSFKKESIRFKNRLHAVNLSPSSSQIVIKQLKKIINNLDKGIEKMSDELLSLANKDKSFMERVEKVASIKGVRTFTVICVLCETNGFFLNKNMRQVVSYAGLDVMEYQSGTINKNGKISKRGNARIRQLLYMPALSAAYRGEKVLQNLHQRVVERNPKIKRKGIIATERKLLTLIYTLWKKNETYNADYHWGGELRN